MRKFIFAGIVAALAVGAFFLGTGLMGSGTDVAKADNNAAVVTKDFGCNLFDGNGILQFTTDSHSVVTQSKATPLGSTVVKCSAKGLANDTGRAVHQDGFLCNTPLGLTNDTHSRVSASGNSTLTCIIHSGTS